MTIRRIRRFLQQRTCVTLGLRQMMRIGLHPGAHLHDLRVRAKGAQWQRRPFDFIRAVEQREHTIDRCSIPANQLLRSQIQLEGAHVADWAFRQSCILERRQRHLKCADNRTGYTLLHIEDIVQRAAEFFRPQLRVAGSVHQLRCYAQRVARRSRTSGERVAHTQQMTNLAHPFTGSLELSRRRAGNHP